MSRADGPTSPLSGIGRTPLVRLARLGAPGSADVLVKLEGGNPTGSYKDRMASSIIEGAERRGALRPGQRVVEFSGGSTGSSLAFVCAVKGYPCTIVSSDAFSDEKLRTMRALGADVVVVPSDGGFITPALFERMRVVLDDIVERDGAHWTDQFHNVDALLGYDAMGSEIVEQTRMLDSPVRVFCAAVGTGGMLAGVARTLRPAIPGLRVVALEPETSPMLTAGRAGPHRVEGIATGIVPPLLVGGVQDEALTVDEGRARGIAAELARREGIFAGTSTALNVTAALDLAAALGSGHTVITVACDSGLKYLAGDLFA